MHAKDNDVQYCVETCMTDIKKLQLLTHGIAKLQTGRLLDKAILCDSVRLWTQILRLNDSLAFW